MKVVEPIEIAAVQRHLTTMHTGVSLNLVDMPGKPDEYRAFKVLLDSEDVERLVLWWQFEKDTKDESFRLTDVLESAAMKPRVKSFVDGNPSKSQMPADLRTLPNMEPVIVTNDLESSFLYLIDGNNRTLAQHLSGKGFQDVPAYVCVHPKMMAWAYIPKYYKRG